MTLQLPVNDDAIVNDYILCLFHVNYWSVYRVSQNVDPWGFCKRNGHVDKEFNSFIQH